MEVIAKKYRILKSLGTGAMGEVFLVLPPRRDPVALKLLKTPETGSQEAAVSQFENEFKVLKKLSHPNIGKIFDYGFDEDLKKVFFTSPWLKGCDLFAATAEAPFEKCEEYFVQVLRAAHYLHQKGMIHCDLKPGNIFVEDDNVLLIDFGLAGYWGESIVGTPTFLAPEIYRGEKHNRASDLYALGVVFYNCLTRTQPFSGASLQEVYDRHRTHTPPPMTELNPKVPKYFSDIVALMLAKKPEERYQSAANIIEEIAAYSKVKYSVETYETLLSYLPTTSELIGRKEVQWRLGSLVANFLSGKGNIPYYGLLIYGDPGLGKTKFLTQIKNELQLEKMQIEEALLPLGETERKVMESAQVIILEDIDHYQTTPEGRASLASFLSFLERKILSPQTTRFLFVASSTQASHGDDFLRLFPGGDSEVESVGLPPLTEEETHAFLEAIIGQKEIPDRFVTELYRNTGGNPGILTQIVQRLIEQGLLFDTNGRWSADLLTHLEDALKRLEAPRSLEEQLALEYERFTHEQKEVMNWLVLCPQGLEEKHFERLVLFPKVGKLLDEMVASKKLRKEGKRYFFYRPAFGPFRVKKLSAAEAKRAHTRLSQSDMGLSEEEVYYHQSLGDDFLLAQEALENLGSLTNRQGRKEEALEHYQRLLRTYRGAPLIQRAQWAIRISELMIWLDRFAQAEELLGTMEKEISQSSEVIPLKQRLLLMEKKGLSYLHQQKLKQAKDYFEKGASFTQSDSTARVEEVRFANDLAQIEMITGHPESAIAIFSQSREKAKNFSKEELRQITNNDLGHVYYQLKDFERAIELLQKDVEFFSEMNNQEPLGRAQYTLAESFRALKKFKKAIKEYERCIKLCQQAHLFNLLLRAYNGLGNIYLAQGNDEGALATYQKAIEISVHLNDPTTKAALLANQGLIYRRGQNWPQASRRFLMAKQILEEKGMRFAYDEGLLSKCCDELTYIALQGKDSIKALSFQLERQQVIDQSEALGAEKFDVRLNLAELYLENRLADSFLKEMRELESMAQTSEAIEKIRALKERWDKIRSFDQESTIKVG